LKRASADTKLAAKYCFFVDGLNEYDGDDEEIIDLLQDLASSKNIKVCVSSRPWNAFMDAFGNSDWQLSIHDLTREDICRNMCKTYLVKIQVSKELPDKIFAVTVSFGKSRRKLKEFGSGYPWSFETSSETLKAKTTTCP
jgi:hypothetical protein